MLLTNRIFRILGILIVIGGIAVIAVAPDFDIIIVGGVMILVGVVMFRIANDKIKKLCSSCGTTLRGAKSAYEEIERESNSHGDEHVHVEFSAVCPACGTLKVFKKKYLVYKAARYNNSGMRTSGDRLYNVERDVERDFRKYFG